MVWGFQVVLEVKNLPANAEDMRHGFCSWVRKIPWRRAWQSTPVFLPGEAHRQRSLVGYSPQGPKASDTTEVTEHAHTHKKVTYCSPSSEEQDFYEGKETEQKSPHQHPLYL